MSVEIDELAYQLSPGMIVADRYEIVRAIAAGAFGQVYEAKHIELSIPVALKLLHPMLSQQTEALGRFEREARVTAQIRHPNICATRDLGRTRNGPFLVMDLLEGRPLEDDLETALSAKQDIPWPVVREIGVGIAEALAAAHAHGVIHRDIKPLNIFIIGHKRATAETVRVLDFGIAQLTQEGAAALTQHGMVGTPAYMSPELLLTRNSASPASDVYALGATLLATLTGLDPYEGDIVNVVAQIVAGAPPDPVLRELRPDVPESFVKIIERSMAKEASDRYTSAKELAAELRTVRGRYSSSPAPSGRTAPLPVPAVARRKRDTEPNLEAPVSSQGQWTSMLEGEKKLELDERALVPGEVVGAGVEVQRVLETDGLLHVYEARRQGARVALRLLTTKNAAAKAKLDQNVSILRQLNNPTLERVIEMGATRLGPFIVSEWLDARPLLTVAARGQQGRGGLTARQAVGVAIALTDGLGAAAKRGLLHHELRPSQAVILNAGPPSVRTARLLGFPTTGVLADDPNAASAHIASTAPERVLKGAPLSERSSVYSLGTLLYAALTGQSAMTGDQVDIIRAMVGGSIMGPALRSVRSDLPEPLVAAVERAMRLDPVQRFPTFAALGFALRSVR